jgi:hypothetical protein
VKSLIYGVVCGAEPEPFGPSPEIRVPAVPALLLAAIAASVPDVSLTALGPN